MNLLNEPSFSEMMQKAWELYRLNFKRLFAIGLIVAILLELLILFAKQSGMIELAMKVMQSNLTEKASENLALQLTPKMQIISILIILMYLIVMPFATALYQHIVDHSWQEKTLTMSEHIKAVLSKMPFIIVATIIVTFLIASSLIISAMIMGVLAIFVYAFFIIYIPLILFDQKRIISSLTESFQLVMGAFGKALMTAVVCYLILRIPSIAAMLIHGLTGNQSDIAFGFDEVITVFLSGFLWPFVAILQLALFYALKARRHNLRAKRENLN